MTVRKLSVIVFASLGAVGCDAASDARDVGVARQALVSVTTVGTATLQQPAGTGGATSGVTNEIRVADLDRQIPKSGLGGIVRVSSDHVPVPATSAVVAGGAAVGW